MPASMSVLASRCTVLFARPRRFARLLMPISYSSSENALIRRMEFATEDRRVLGFAGALTLRSMYQNLIPICGTRSYQRSQERTSAFRRARHVLSPAATMRTRLVHAARE